MYLVKIKKISPDPEQAQALQSCIIIIIMHATVPIIKYNCIVD
jgi:hypothetical protein